MPYVVSFNEKIYAKHILQLPGTFFQKLFYIYFNIFVLVSFYIFTAFRVLVLVVLVSIECLLFIGLPPHFRLIIYQS